MATYSAGVALAFTYEVADGTTGSFSPGGDDRAIFGTIVCGGFFGLPSITSLQYDNSSGTTITRIGTDLTWVGGNGSQAIFGLAPGESGTKALYGDWAGNPLQSAIAGISYSGVDQTTPFSGQVDATPTLVTGVTTTVASVTVTGCTAGQTIIAAVGALSDSVTLSAFTAVSGTTLRVSDVTGTFVGAAMLEKVATGSSETLSVNVNAGSSGGLYWTARGIRVNDAAGGGGPTYTLTADGATFSYSGASAGLLFGRVLGANGATYAYTGTDASLLRSFNLSALGGTYAYSGGAATLQADRILGANGATFSYSGADATLTYTPVGSYSPLVADPATYSYTGGAANLVYGRVLQALGGAYSYTGQDATITLFADVVDYTLSADSVTYAYAGAEAQLIYSGAPVATGQDGSSTKPRRRRRPVDDSPVIEEVPVKPAMPAPAEPEVEDEPPSQEEAEPVRLPEAIRASIQKTKAAPEPKVRSDKAQKRLAKLEQELAQAIARQEEDDLAAINAAVELLLS